MFYGYHRVSTKEQNLERGIKGIEDFCKSRNYKLEKVFVDKMSGKTVDRPRYTVLKEDVLREGDTLIIYELDRLARDKKAISNELRYYDEHNIRVMILDIPTTTTDLPDTDAMNKLIVETINKVIIDVYAMLAETELQRKTKAEQAFKASIMKKHTLEGVITCNTDTFYGVGTNPVIAVFTAHEPHPEDKVCKFIDFRDDGYEVRAHVGLVEGDSAKDKKQHLLDVWNGRVEAPSKFCVESTVQPDDEWLHSFYYFNDEIPTESDFEKAIGDYLSFEFSMIMQNREYLFTGGESDETE